jgi:hypothetical protein
MSNETDSQMLAMRRASTENSDSSPVYDNSVQRTLPPPQASMNPHSLSYHNLHYHPKPGQQFFVL